MKNKFKGLILFILPILIVSIATPEVAFASWWNPYTWFKKENVVMPILVPVQQPSPSEQIHAESTAEIKPVTKPVQSKKTVHEKVVAKSIEIIPVAISTTTEVVTPKENYKLEDVIQAWRPYVVRVTCITLDTQGNKKSYSDGSGLLSKGVTKGIIVLTNKHVLYTTGGASSDYCDVYFPESKEVVKVEKADRSFSSKGYDMAALTINQPSEYISNLVKNNQTTGKDCKTANSESTDDIVIMGYPMGKPKDDISHSQGKIVGYNERFFISTATMISGYSGGVAVSLKDNCYLGIPTYAQKDDLSKSLILDSNKF
jgi:hypothetical protein